ncbi:MAG: diphthine--ammonia ligase [Candidatus Diapherotrites archaeon]|nr:diphthine--ammonia ligase [Candidatus Diapherotrites archaeon]
MKTAILFSGGKDSCYALYWALNQAWNVRCLVSILPRKPDSYMFHYPNVAALVEKQAKLVGLPILKRKTDALKEKELDDLKQVLSEAKEKHSIEAVVSGAVQSEYQKTRIERVCYKLGLKSFVPLWHKDPERLARDEARTLKIIIVGVYAEGLDESWLGRTLDGDAIAELVRKKISPIGEGGEFETLVVDAPFFKEPLKVKEKSRVWDGVRGEVSFC